jgi:hypothetical protein
MCCTALVFIVTCKSFDVLASPPRVPTTSSPSCLPHHANAFLTASSPPQCFPHGFLTTSSQLVASSNRAKRCVSISTSHFISSLLLSSSLNIIPSIGKASSTCILSTPSQPTSNQPPTPNFPSSASHTADMKSNYNMLAMAAAAAQANAMPSQQLW